MTATTQNTLAQAFGVTEGRSARLKETGLVIAGVALLILSAKIRVPMWPVPMTFQTFAALTIGAAYGLRLGLLTNVIYLALGALGLAVFTGEGAGLAYLAGPTGGYLVGFAAAAALTGWLAERGWSRTVPLMVASLVLGNLVIYACGLGWMSVLFAADQGFGWVLANGLVPFLPGDILKVALAALLVPAVWRMARQAPSLSPGILERPRLPCRGRLRVRPVRGRSMTATGGRVTRSPGMRLVPDRASRHVNGTEIRHRHPGPAACRGSAPARASRRLPRDTFSKKKELF